MRQTEMPISVDEIFSNNDCEYYFSSDYEMDNIEAMNYLKETLGISPDKLIEQKYELVTDEGTCIFLTEPNEFKVVRIESRGAGDMYSHSFDVWVNQFDDYQQMIKYLG